VHEALFDEAIGSLSRNLDFFSLDQESGWPHFHGQLVIADGLPERIGHPLKSTL
jgi:hypothetical protein